MVWEFGSTGACLESRARRTWLVVGCAGGLSVYNQPGAGPTWGPRLMGT